MTGKGAAQVGGQQRSLRREDEEGSPQAAVEQRRLRMGELARRSGVSAGTIRHYLREGLLGEGREIERTSRNMAYYPPELVQRIELIKRLQEQRFMPLRVIRELLKQSPERAAAMIELEDRIVERALASAERRFVSGKRVRERYEIPENVLARLAEIGVLTPSVSKSGAVRYGEDDVKIIEAISRFRAGGYEEELGFTVYDTLRYRQALEPLVREEVTGLLERLAGEVSVPRALQMIEAGAEPLRELIGAMHSKLLLAELRRQREYRRGSDRDGDDRRRGIKGDEDHPRRGSDRDGNRRYPSRTD